MSMFKIIESVQAYAASDPARFHMPGHKGRLGMFAEASALDLTELEISDDLYAPKSGFADALDIMTDFYGTKATVISAHGATLPIFAAVYLYSKENRPFLCSRKVHRSVINALAVCGCGVRFIPDTGDGIELSALEAALSYPDYSGLILTSADYYGRLEDLSPVIEKCKRANLPVIADNSHGSHLFFDGSDAHPLRLGANAVIDSYHKTLPTMTGGALLHTMDFDRSRVLDAFRLFASTSPSYVISLSVLSAFELMKNDGCRRLSQLRETVAETTNMLKKLGMGVASFARSDPYRFCTECADSAAQYSSFLSKRGVVCEFCDDTYTVFIPSVMNNAADFGRLIEATREFTATHEIKPAVRPPRYLHIPEPAVSIRSAVFSDKETIGSELAEGRIAAEELSPYPPGIPLIIPGERIDKCVISALISAGFDKIKVMAR